jgi:branched-chain amino acid transport system ATP-binding protein
MLEVADLHVHRGATHVLKGVSLHVGRGEIVALVGANGAGKSTTLQTLSGLLRPRSGAMRYTPDGRTLDLAAMSPEMIVRAGLVHCPEGRQVFKSLSVGENLALGAYVRADRAAVARDVERVHALFPVLAERRALAAGSLSGGEQMMLAIGRALLAAPKLLLLDEPSLGLAPQMVDAVFDVILDLRQAGVTILLVEQNAAMALEIADRAYVLETGRIVLADTGSRLLENDSVRQAYLGAGA